MQCGKMRVSKILDTEAPRENACRKTQAVKIPILCQTRQQERLRAQWALTSRYQARLSHRPARPCANPAFTNSTRSLKPSKALAQRNTRKSIEDEDGTISSRASAIVATESWSIVQLVHRRIKQRDLTTRAKRGDPVLFSALRRKSPRPLVCCITRADLFQRWNAQYDD